MKAKQKHLLLFLTVFLAVSTITTNFIPTAQADITNGLVGYWPFNEGTGTTTYDYSGFSNTGTLINNPTWVTGKIGNALQFNGATNYITIPSSASLNITESITLSCWINPSGNGKILIKSTSAGYDPPYADYSISWFDNHTEGFVIGNSNFISSNGVVPPNSWSLITLTYDGITEKIYVNGVLDNTLATTGAIPTSNQPLLVAARNGGEFYTGLIDDIRIYNRALSASEVSALYYYPAPTPSPTPATYPSATPIASPVFLNSISSSPLWQYLYAWDIAGFVIATWTFSLGQSFFVIVAFIVSLAIYIRYQNLVAVSIIWIVLGSVFVVWIPMVTPFIIFAFAFGFGSLMYKVYETRN